MKTVTDLSDESLNDLAHWVGDPEKISPRHRTETQIEVWAEFKRRGLKY